MSIFAKVFGMRNAVCEIAETALSAVLIACALPGSAAHAAVESDAVPITTTEADLRTQHRLELAGELSVMFKQCTKSVAGFEVKNRAPLKIWARDNAANLAELERHTIFGPPYRDRLTAASKPSPASWADDLNEYCDAIAQRELGQKPSGPPAATPQQTWDSFTAALRRADKASALLCVSLEIRSQYRAMFDGMTSKAMQAMADHIKVVKMSTLIGGSSPDTASIATAVVETRDGNGGEIMFVKSKLNGRWQIASM